MHPDELPWDLSLYDAKRSPLRVTFATENVPRRCFPHSEGGTMAKPKTWSSESPASRIVSLPPLCQGESGHRCKQRLGQTCGRAALWTASGMIHLGRTHTLSSPDCQVNTGESCFEGILHPILPAIMADRKVFKGAGIQRFRGPSPRSTPHTHTISVSRTCWKCPTNSTNSTGARAGLGWAGGGGCFGWGALFDGKVLRWGHLIFGRRHLFC